MGNMQMYANVCWMGRPEAQWEIKAPRDGEGCGGDYELNAAVLNREKQPIAGPVVKLITINLTNRSMLMAADSKVICQTILVASKVIRDRHL